MTIPASLKRHAAKIDAVDDCRADQNGWWVYLKYGWIYDGVHQIHEDTLKECAGCLSMVEKCDCEECLSFLASKTAIPC